MDAPTNERIKFLHPKIREEVRTTVSQINSVFLGNGLRLRIAFTLRSVEEQNELYSQGRTKSGKIVTNAKGGQSLHNYGLAFDIVLLLDKNNDGVFETASWDIKSDNDHDGKADWMEVVNYLKSLGWAWGGDWKSFPDFPHFEKAFGYNWKTLLQKWNSGDVFTEIIEGKTYKWINL